MHKRPRTKQELIYAQQTVALMRSTELACVTLLIDILGEVFNWKDPKRMQKLLDKYIESIEIWQNGGYDVNNLIDELDKYYELDLRRILKK